MSYYNQINEALHRLREEQGLRTLQPISFSPDGHYVILEGDTLHPLVNLNSNDYLGLQDTSRHFSDESYWKTWETENHWIDPRGAYEESVFIGQGSLPIRMGSASSRLLTGDRPEIHLFEEMIARSLEHEAALLFNSGYHANTGLLPALALPGVVILADKLVHASMIDGLRLARGRWERWHHNDLKHLTQRLEYYQEAPDCQAIIVVVESIYSMDGDLAPLRELVELKSRFPRLLLYVDEAHAIGVRGSHGYGLAEEYGVLTEIDFLVGTLGKALNGMGAYVACRRVVREWLINSCRSLIFSTMLPPAVVEWGRRVWARLPEMQARRAHLSHLVDLIRALLADLPQTICSQWSSHIVPLVCGSPDRARALASALRERGFYARPIMHPTVPQGSERIRLSLTAGLSSQEVEAICQVIRSILVKG